MGPESDTSHFADHPLAPRIPPSSSRTGQTRSSLGAAVNGLDWRQAIGGALVAIGTIAILIAWWQISGTPYPGEQMPPLASGGIGGAALIAIGVLLLNAFEHAKDRDALAQLLERLDESEARAQQAEQRLLREIEQLATAASTPPASEQMSRARRPRAKATS